MAAAPKKGRLNPVKKAASGLLAHARVLTARIPFLPKRPSASIEPFSAIEDETPLGDLLSSTNAAPSMASRASESEKPDFRALIDAVVRNPPVLVGIFVVLVLILAIAVTAIIVAAPPRAPAATVPLTEEGQALVRSWLSPPGDPLEPRMAMERESIAAYTAEDAARLGIDPDPDVIARLREKNSAAIEDLYGTVP